MRIRSIASAAIIAAFSVGAGAQAPAPKTLKIQSSWPASLTIQDHFRIIASNIEKVTGGSIKIESEVHRGTTVILVFPNKSSA